MAGEVSFKAYLHKENEESKAEVRRFSLDQNVATSFIYLKEKLRSLFTPLVLSQSFDIYWKDSDGDNVTICSDEELTIALTESRNEDIIKVYIKNISKPEATPVNTTKGPSHDGIFCDGCEKPISGFRYKCLGCRDYDLCGVCEAKGIHGEHFTLRIPTPLNMRHHFGHRLINKISKAARKAESRCPWTHPHENNLADDFATNCTTNEAMPPRPHCFRTRSNAGGHGRRASAQSCADPQECGQACGSSQPQDTAPAATITIDPAQIAQIPNVIFNTLADFGIDLAHFFPAPQTSQTATTSNSNEQAKAETASKTADESSAPKIAKMANTTAPTAPSAANAGATVNAGTTANAGATVNAGTTANAGASDATAQANKDKYRTSLLDDWTVYNPNETQETKEPEPIEIDLEMDINSPASSVVGEKEKSTSGSVASQPTGVPSTSNANLYPSLAGLPKNKKVAEALDQMLAMGFKNDDGWLTNLLNLQEGSIPKVLDLIQSAAQRKQ